MSNMVTPLRFIFLLGILTIFGLGVYDMLTNFESNGCEMTYMFEWPEYIKIPLDPGVEKEYPQNGLYAYGEGSYARMISQNKFEGIPVLFIPGNAGSQNQVRSLGSVALRKSKASGSTVHFNYFAAGFNEEPYGLTGALEDKAKYVNLCLKKILSLYSKQKNPPKTVILVGHSMGGVVARALFTLQDFDPSSVNTIITQATPHQAPVVALDPFTMEFYKKVNQFWKNHENTKVKDVTVFSTGGGYRDVLVRGDLAGLQGIVKPNRAVSTSTMSVARAWVSTDHLCHVWCKQIVLATKRAMFDIIDPSSKQVAVNPVYRWKAFYHHFIHNYGPKSVHQKYPETVNLDTNIKWEMRKKPAWKLNRAKIHATRYSVIEVPKMEDFAFVIVSNLPSDSWLVGCKLKPKQEKCNQGTNLVPRANLLPPQDSDRKVVFLDPTELTEFTHLIVILSKTSSAVEVAAEMYNMGTRNLLYDITGVLSFTRSWNFSFVQNYPASVLSSDILVPATDSLAVYYNISLKGLTGPLQAYTAVINPVQCTEKPASEMAGTVARLFTPWSGEYTYKFAKYGEMLNHSVKLQTARPPGFIRDAELHLLLNPGCTYRVSVHTAWTELYGQFVRFYGVMLPAFLAIQILQAFGFQLQQMDLGQQAPCFLTAHATWGAWWRLVPLGVLFTTTVSDPQIIGLLSKVGIPEDDTVSLRDRGLWIAVLPLFLYMISFAIVSVHAVIAGTGLSILGRLFGFIFSRCSCIKVRWLSVLEYFLLVLGCLASCVFCGTIGALTAYIICFIKVISYSYQVTKATADVEKMKQHNKRNSYFTLLMLFLLLLIINAPPLLVWGRNLRYTPFMKKDPSQTSGLVMCLVVICLKCTDFPNKHSWNYESLPLLMFVGDICLMAYGLVSVYRVTYFICGVLVLLVVPRLTHSTS